MNNKISVAAISLAVSCVAFLANSCQKLQDYIHHPGDNDYKTCNIKTLTAYDEYGVNTIDTITYNFVYNALGNPVSVTNNLVGTGNPNYRFVYDNRNRLIQFLKPYTGATNYEEWHNYSYNNQGQIVIDTAYGFGEIVAGVPQATIRYAVYEFQYDSQNRIKHEKITSYSSATPGNVTEHDFPYDANGNLVKAVAYDNKLSLYRTNAVWMFIAKDYSVNNPFTAAAYNQNSLPLRFRTSGLNLIPATYGNVKVDYLCH